MGPVRPDNCYCKAMSDLPYLSITPKHYSLTVNKTLYILSSFVSGHPGLPEFLLPFRKPKRIRTAFSPSQLLKLEQAFEKNQYVVGQERKELAKSLNLSETQVCLFSLTFLCPLKSYANVAKLRHLYAASISVLCFVSIEENVQQIHCSNLHLYDHNYRYFAFNIVHNTLANNSIGDSIFAPLMSSCNKTEIIVSSLVTWSCTRDTSRVVSPERMKTSISLGYNSPDYEQPALKSNKHVK